MLSCDHRLPLVHLLQGAIDGLPEPALLLDPDLRLAHVNAAAAPLFVGRIGDQAPVACLAPVLEGRPCCGPRCGGCQLYRSLRVSLVQGESVGPFHLDRQACVDGHLVTRRYAATAHPYRLDGRRGLLVTLQEVDAEQRLAG